MCKYILVLFLVSPGCITASYSMHLISLKHCCVSATVSGFALKLGWLLTMLYVGFLQRQTFMFYHTNIVRNLGGEVACQIRRHLPFFTKIKKLRNCATIFLLKII